MQKRNLKRYLLATLLLANLLFNLGCPGKEETLFKNMVTRFGRPPKITVYMKDTGQKKSMDIEEYLLGVVAGEMKPGWPLEAYAAQAVIARTFTMEFLGRGGTRKLHNTDISTDEKEAQAYNAAAITPTIRRAVQITKGLVLTYKERYIKGWYSASCGGTTTYAKEGLAYKGPEPPYIKPVKCPEAKYIPDSELYWQCVLTSDLTNKALQQMNQKPVGILEKFTILQRSGTQRVTLIKLTGDKGTATVSGADFRVNYGPEKIRSIWISNQIENQPGHVKIVGRGFGHGVGLCQWGAYTLARDNRSFREIIKHYYPKAHLSKIW
ncbi:MAG: SpoIID/LytB domain-containing protein [Firmicutes bacterium]|nr:SpoIID/LytB domain-containing protein [Bacillota bacterium]